MGGGISSLPLQIDKNKFRELTGGSMNDYIFDQFAVKGLMSRDKLIELSQIKDIYFSFCETADSKGVPLVNRVTEIAQRLHQKNISATALTNLVVDSHIVSNICSTIDKSRCVVLFISPSYLQEICSSNAHSKCKIEFVYALRKKLPVNIIPIVAEESLRNPANWPPAVIQALTGIQFMDFSNDANIVANVEALFTRVTECTRGTIVPTAREEFVPLQQTKDEREENQFYQWMSRSTPIEESRRIVYCASLVSAGISNVNTLAQRLVADPHVLTKLGVNDYDSDAICQAVGLLCIGYTYHRDFDAMSSFESALFVLKKAIEAPEDHLLAANALNAAARIAKQGLEMVTTMQNAGFCPAIVRVTRTHLAHANVVEAASLAIAVLADGSDECKEAFGLASVGFFLSRALQGHTDSPLVIQYSCAAVAALARWQANKERLGTCGVCEILVRAINKNITHEGVALHGCEAMENLQINYYANTAKLGNAGGHETLTNILRSHPNSPGVACAAFRCMTILALDYDNRSLLGRVICEAFVVSLRNNCSNATVASLGCKAIVSIVVGKANHRDCIGDVGGCEAVKLALASHLDNPVVILNACQACYSLAKGSAKNIAKFQGIQQSLRSIAAKKMNYSQDIQNHLQEAMNTIR